MMGNDWINSKPENFPPDLRSLAENGAGNFHLESNRADRSESLVVTLKYWGLQHPKPKCRHTLVWVAIWCYLAMRFHKWVWKKLVAETGAAIRIVNSACCSVINVCIISSPLAPNDAGGNHCHIHIHTFSPHSLLFSLFFSLSLCFLPVDPHRKGWMFV